MRGILRDNLDEGNCGSKIAARQWGEAILAARHFDISQGPLDSQANQGRGDRHLQFLPAVYTVCFLWRKSKLRLSNGGARPLSATRAQLPAIVHTCGPFVKGTFVAN